jgi:hypothetical protein
MSVEAFFKWFQAKAGLKAHEPQKLVVFGAGYAEVNGEYTFASRNSTTNIEGTEMTFCSLSHAWKPSLEVVSVGSSRSIV